MLWRGPPEAPGGSQVGDDLYERVCNGIIYFGKHQILHGGLKECHSTSRVHPASMIILVQACTFSLCLHILCMAPHLFDHACSGCCTLCGPF